MHKTRNWVTILLALLSFATSAQVLTFRTPPSNPHGLYIRDVLIELYHSIGYEVEFVDYPPAREIMLAEQSTLSGVLARDTIIEKHSPSLIRIMTPLFDYQILVIADRRRCNYCFVEQLSALAYPRLGAIFQHTLQQFEHLDTIPVALSGSIEGMVSKQFIEAGMTTNLTPDDAYTDDPNLIRHTLTTRYDYHYLAPNVAEIAPKVQQAMQQMERSGRLQFLKSKYQISPPSELYPNKPSQLIFLISNRLNDDKAQFESVMQQFKLMDGDKRLVNQQQAQVALDQNLPALVVSTQTEDMRPYLRSNYHLTLLGDAKTPVFAFFANTEEGELSKRWFDWQLEQSLRATH